MHPVVFTRTASAEFIDAQEWYENESPGLGRGFRQAVDAVIERMSASPRQFPVIPQERPPRPASPLSLRAHVRHRAGRHVDRRRMFPRQPRSGALAKAGVKSFLVQRLKNEPDKFIVMPWPDPPTDPPTEPFGLVHPQQEFRGTEEETRKYLAEKGQTSGQIQALIDSAKHSPEL